MAQTSAADSSSGQDFVSALTCLDLHSSASAANSRVCKDFSSGRTCLDSPRLTWPLQDVDKTLFAVHAQVLFLLIIYNKPISPIGREGMGREEGTGVGGGWQTFSAEANVREDVRRERGQGGAVEEG